VHPAEAEAALESGRRLGVRVERDTPKVLTAKVVPHPGRLHRTARRSDGRHLPSATQGACVPVTAYPTPGTTRVRASDVLQHRRAAVPVALQVLRSTAQAPRVVPRTTNGDAMERADNLAWRRAAGRAVGVRAPSCRRTCPSGVTATELSARLLTGDHGPTWMPGGRSCGGGGGRRVEGAVEDDARAGTHRPIPFPTARKNGARRPHRKATPRAGAARVEGGQGSHQLKTPAPTP
jgi:hypothetical protein